MYPFEKKIKIFFNVMSLSFPVESTRCRSVEGNRASSRRSGIWKPAIMTGLIVTDIFIIISTHGQNE